MTAPMVLLTGGTGTLGRAVAPLLVDAGVAVRILTRDPGDRDAATGVEYVAGDLATGDGIEAAVRGVDTIVHAAGNAKGDEELTRTLVRAATAAGAPHLVFISVVGADRVPVVSRVDRAMFGYFAEKRAAERVVEESGLPWTILRATQFHDLMLTVVRATARLPVVPVPAGFRFQPVGTDEVAARLVELALGVPAGLVPDLGGPKALGLDELVRGYLSVAGKHRPVLKVRPPGGAARAIRDGANLTPRRAVGRQTWEEFLAERVPVDA